jgi:hypothetical protein
MKSYRQIHIIARDRSFTYEPIANTPEFKDLNSALEYWEYNKKRIEDSNFYNDPTVLIRREIHTVIERELT